MKKLNKEQLDSILEIVGNEVSTGFTSPKSGTVTVKAMTPVGAQDRTDAQGNLVHINPWVRVDFNEGGSASLRSILISPDITWDNKPTQGDRVQALAEASLTFTYMESKVAKTSGNPYKVAHFVPQTL